MIKVSGEVLEELRLFFNAVVLGAVFSFAYDGWLILRNVFKHSRFWISVQDLLFWLCTAVAAFLYLQEQSNGVLRWFLVAGAALGMFLYKSSCSRFYVKYSSKMLQYLVVNIKRLLYFVLKPLKWLKKCLKSGILAILRPIKKVTIMLKKRLTVCIKRFTISLCKHNGENGDLHNDKEV